MRWDSRGLFFVSLLLILIFYASCTLIAPKSSVHYRSPEVSAVIVDADTGKPIEGVKVEVSWSALRPKYFEGSDLTNLHAATVVTDTNGVFTIPAWQNAVAREWRYYEFDPMVSYSKSGYKSDYKDNHNNQDSVTPHALPFVTVTLERPSWNGQRLPLKISDGKGEWPEWMQKDRSLMYNPYLSPSDPELGKKIAGTWTRDTAWNNSLVKITNTFKSYGGPSGSFVFTGTILSTNGTQEGTWQTEGSWNIRHAFLVNKATSKTVPPDFVRELNLVLMEEKITQIKDDELVVADHSVPRVTVTYKRVK